MILDALSTCNNAALTFILPTIKRVMLLIQIIVPIILIIMGVVQFTQLVNAPDDKKKFKALINKVIAAIIVFFIPVLLNVVMGVIGESTEFSNCWIKADENVKITDSKYKEWKKRPKYNVITGGEYEESKKPTNSETSRYIFVGDSRTVQMYAYKTGNWSTANYSDGGIHPVENDIFIAQGSQGLEWMKSTGMPAASKYMAKKTALIILMGVNDISNVDNYISYLKENVGTWKEKGVKVYFVSVNPCEGSYSSMNSKITSFNSKLKNNLPSDVKWIDTYSHLMSDGYKTTDGLHYNEETSNKIYNYIKSAL